MRSGCRMTLQKLHEIAIFGVGQICSAWMSNVHMFRSPVLWVKHCLKRQTASQRLGGFKEHCGCCRSYGETGWNYARRHRVYTGTAGADSHLDHIADPSSSVTRAIFKGAIKDCNFHLESQFSHREVTMHKNSFVPSWYLYPFHPYLRRCTTSWRSMLCYQRCKKQMLHIEVQWWRYAHEASCELMLQKQVASKTWTNK